LKLKEDGSGPSKLCPLKLSKLQEKIRLTEGQGLPWDSNEGCFARAAAANYVLRAAGLAKIPGDTKSPGVPGVSEVPDLPGMAYAMRTDKELSVYPLDRPEPIFWNYHVALVVRYLVPGRTPTPSNGQYEYFILDPMLSPDAPLGLEVWLRVMKNAARLSLCDWASHDINKPCRSALHSAQDSEDKIQELMKEVTDSFTMDIQHVEFKMKIKSTDDPSKVFQLSCSLKLDSSGLVHKVCVSSSDVKTLEEYLFKHALDNSMVLYYKYDQARKTGMRLRKLNVDSNMPSLDGISARWKSKAPGSGVEPVIVF